MRRLMIAILTLAFAFSFAGCGKDDTPVINEPIPGDKLKISVGSSVFRATLYDNPTAAAFKALLPLTLDMSELNGNEKLFRFSGSLPTNASRPGTIQNGDMMLYGSNTLVLFYKSFSSSYSYTRIGKVDDVSGYASALGAGSVTVNFELEE